jgi:hypothetical protein
LQQQLEDSASKHVTRNSVAESKAIFHLPAFCSPKDEWQEKTEVLKNRGSSKAGSEKMPNITERTSAKIVINRSKIEFTNHTKGLFINIFQCHFELLPHEFI